jgi:hypothetical protein
MRLMLLGAMVAAIALTAAPAMAQSASTGGSSNGGGSSRGGFVSSPHGGWNGGWTGGGWNGGGHGGWDRDDDDDDDDDWRRRRRGGTFVINSFGYHRGWVNNRHWDSDSYNDWWHDQPWRSYPRWLQNNERCERMWWSGGGWRC